MAKIDVWHIVFVCCCFAFFFAIAPLVALNLFRKVSGQIKHIARISKNVASQRLGPALGAQGLLSSTKTITTTDTLTDPTAHPHIQADTQILWMCLRFKLRFKFNSEFLQCCSILQISRFSHAARTRTVHTNTRAHAHACTHTHTHTHTHTRGNADVHGNADEHGLGRRMGCQ